jgi:hypothetical protein
VYGIEVITPPATDPVAAADLRAWLRLNDTSEDGVLAELLAGAVDLFENDTNRPLIATTYRQHLARWPWGPAIAGGPSLPYTTDPSVPAIAAAVGLWYPGQIVLGRGGVTVVGGVYRKLADGSTETLAGWTADLSTPPARVSLSATPAPVLTAAGVPVSPVGYVEYTAGWASAAAVPRVVVTALKLLAAHWYKNREAHAEQSLNELPDGWRRVVSRYKLGISGDWGQ